MVLVATAMEMGIVQGCETFWFRKPTMGFWAGFGLVLVSSPLVAGHSDRRSSAGLRSAPLQARVGQWPGNDSRS